MSKVLLVNTPFYRLLGSRYNCNSLGIAYIASVLNQNGHDAWLYNADYVNERSFIKLNQIFEQFHDYKKYFENENHEVWEEVISNIVEFNPDWVGWTGYTANLSSIRILSKKLRERMPHVKQVVGGPHATMDAELLNKIPTVDYQVKREGEAAMLSLVRGEDPKHISGVVSRNRIQGLNVGFNDNGDADVNKDVDNLPFPERDKLWKVPEEEKKFVDVSYVVTIRGCPYRCSYCASPRHWKRDKTQYRSPDSVIAELHHLKNNYWNREKEFDYSASANIGTKDKLIIKDNTVVYFVDDIFTIKKARTMEILQRMIDEGLNMPWKAEMRTDHLDQELCDLMAKAGCVRAKIGIETGSPRLLKQIKKDETREEIIDGCKMLEKAGVPYTAYLMTGFPGETDDDLRQTISLAKEINAEYYSLSVMSPYFGTEIYYDLIKQGYPLDKAPDHYFFHQSSEMMVNNLISKEVLDEYLALNERNKGKGYI
jgi:anaerobic magnesium-protoporphyrin IX monomethyl ester cyclase